MSVGSGTSARQLELESAGRRTSTFQPFFLRRRSSLSLSWSLAAAVMADSWSSAACWSGVMVAGVGVSRGSGSRKSGGRRVTVTYDVDEEKVNTGLGRISLGAQRMLIANRRPTESYSPASAGSPDPAQRPSSSSSPRPRRVVVVVSAHGHAERCLHVRRPHIPAVALI